ncbi:cysteine-rich receptor-like protein kinase 44, partial [Triticum urartu]|uniref:cysteine-rich receptor-like protein kinase 44 n=1 Tax=Triticum urartu TaxID=4572 RepID=UPI0020441F66
MSSVKGWPRSGGPEKNLTGRVEAALSPETVRWEWRGGTRRGESGRADNGMEDDQSRLDLECAGGDSLEKDSTPQHVGADNGECHALFGHKVLHNISFSLLKSITRNFSEAQEVGRGGFGVVYKGVLPSGRTIAVKQLFERYEILDKTFDSEIDCIAGLKHKNTVRFLGYSSETQRVRRLCDGKLQWVRSRQRLLCFEYLPKGCLAPYLSDASCGLHWTTRYQIIKGICEGVHYLHQHRIIHRDFKPQNVLLDDNMVPKIADFGLSRHLNESQSRDITENKFGTMGYMAPEFFNNGEITFKTDVYSLGVIIMEILMGHKECSNVKEIVESWTNKFRTSDSHTTLEEVKVCAEIGIKCRNYDPRNRPATWSIIRGILDEAEISNWSVTSDVATSTEGQIRLASKRLDELKLMDDSATPSQQQPSTLEVEQEGGKVSQERKRKASTVSVVTGLMSTLSGKL